MVLTVKYSSFHVYRTQLIKLVRNFKNSEIHKIQKINSEHLFNYLNRSATS